MEIDVRAVDFGYEGTGGATSVFRRFDLHVESRSVHSIVGPSGCGKSTLLRLIAGVEQPLRGRIELRGTPVGANPVALVFQDPRLLPWWSVGRNVGMGVEFDHRRRGLYDRILSFTLDRVGLKDLAGRRADTLSRGQQTRASIGRAMAYDADVTLLDEPFVHLDTITKQRMWQEFETYWQLEARTFLLVTHDIDEAVLLSDRVTVLSGAQPTSVVETVEIGLRRPRSPALRTDPGFRSAVARLWHALDPGASR